MTPPPAIVDTNVVVAAFLTGAPESPTARIVEAMLGGRIVFLLSLALLSEYREVLLRPAIRALHGLASDEVDQILEEIVLRAAIREPSGASTPTTPPPDPGDQHLWDLLAAEPHAILITGDRKLLEVPPPGRSIVSPADFVRLLDG